MRNTTFCYCRTRSLNISIYTLYISSLIGPEVPHEIGLNRSLDAARIIVLPVITCDFCKALSSAFVIFTVFRPVRHTFHCITKPLISIHTLYILSWNAFSTKKRFSHLKKIHRIINFWRVFKCGSQIFKVLVEQNSWVEKWPHFGGKKALNISTILRSSGGKWKSTVWIHCRPRSTARVPLGLSWWIEKIHTVEKYGPNQTST